MNSYRRGLRNDVLVNPKLFILEKVNLAPHTNGWSNLVKLGQTWPNLVKRVKNLYYLVRVVTTYPLKEKFRPRNSYLCHGRDEGTSSAFGPPAPRSPPRLGGFSTESSLRILSCCEAPSLLYPESALVAPRRISHPSARSLASPTHVRNLGYTCGAWRCGKHYGLKKAPPASLIYKPLDLSSQ